MSAISAVFSLVDEMSFKMDAIASSGLKALNSIDDAAAMANDAFDSASESAESASRAIDGMSHSLDSYENALSNSQSATSDYSSSLEDMFGLCEQAAGNLYQALEAGTDIHQKLADAAGDSSEALIELEKAQADAERAMNYYDQVLISGTEDLGELEKAAETAQHAAEQLAEANGKAADEIEKVSKQSEEAGDKGEEAGKQGVNAAEVISTTLATLGITEKLKDIADAAFEIANAFSEAESTVVKATGATGDALNGLEDSMMSAYSTARDADLDATAGAIGEINTRLGYTGDELTTTTNKFLDFASATGGNATGSVRTVTQLMNQWNVSNKDLSLTLDKLTYAGQVSGISVDSLSSQLTNNKAVLEQLGFTLDDSIAMFSQFELKGTNTATVMTGFRTALSSGAITSLEDLYNTFDKIQMGLITTTDAADIFGKRAGPAIVNAVKDGSFAVDDLKAALESSQGTLETTTDAAQTMEQKMNQAQNSIKTAFTEAVQPMAEGVNEVFANLLDGVGEFLQEHPAVTKAIVALTTAIGVLVAGIAGITFVTKVAIPAIKTLGTAIAGSMGPIGWVVIGITALTAGLGALAAMSKTEVTEYDKLTEASKRQSDELDNLNAEYEKTCEQFGETSDEARAMKYDLDEATESFNANKKTVAELYSEIDSLCETANNSVEAYQNSTKEIDDQQENAQILIAKLKELGSTSEKTAGTQLQMEAIIDRLNTDFPELGISIKDVNGNLDGMIDKIDKLSGAQSKQAKYNAAKTSLADFKTEEEKLKKALQEAEDARAAAGKKYSDVVGDNIWSAGRAFFSGDEKEYNKMYEEALAKEEAARKALGDVQAQIKDCETTIDEYGDMVTGTSEETVTAYDAITVAVNDVSAQTQELIEKYNEAYAAAHDSVSGQYSIWENAAEVIPTSVYTINTALDSQVDYWDKYNTNLTNLLDKGDKIDGLTDVLAAFSDGSPESVNAIAGMAQASDDQLKQMVESYKKLQEQQDKVATSLADTRVDFEGELDKITGDMEKAVGKMNLDEEASKAATATIEAYAAAIRATKGKAVDAAAAVAAETQNAIYKAYDLSNPITDGKSGTSTPTTGYAVGTENAKPGLALVGENGPELINFGGGEIVYPTDKTEKILDSLASGREYKAAVPESRYDGENSFPAVPSVQYSAPDKSEKTITLEIAGSGKISIDKGTNKNEILSVLQANLAPVLLNIIQNEVFEEGESAYDY